VIQGQAVKDGGLMPHQAPEHSLLADYPFVLEYACAATWRSPVSGKKTAIPDFQVSQYFHLAREFYLG
jgi:hypothetical protein